MAMRFRFNWAINGSTIIKADSFKEAQNIFDYMSNDELEDRGESEFCQLEVLTEIKPTIWEELP